MVSFQLQRALSWQLGRLPGMDETPLDMELIAMSLQRHVRPPSPATRLPFRIRTLGRIRGQIFHATAGTYNDDAMLTLVQSGVGYYHLGRKVERVSRGFVGLVLPSANPGLLIADAEQPYDHFYCRFAGYEAMRMAKAISVKYGGVRFWPHTAWPAVISAFEVMLATEWQAPTDDSPWMDQTEGELARLLALLLTPSAMKEPQITEAGIRMYLLDHLAEPLDLDKMAQHFSVSRYHLSRRAHTLFGARLSQVSRELKLNFSLSLLEATSLELSIEDIARRVGYEDPLYFSKVFHRHVGKSPSRYRADWVKTH